MKLIYFPLLLAQQPAGTSGGQASPFLAFLPLLIMLVIFYILLIRPQQKRQREADEMVRNLKKGDRVVTAGGVIGTIVAPPNKEGIAVLRIGEDTKIEILKSSITQKKS